MDLQRQGVLKLRPFEAKDIQGQGHLRPKTLGAFRVIPESLRANLKGPLVPGSLTRPWRFEGMSESS
jgi:hypothetical protein